LAAAATFDSQVSAVSDLLHSMRLDAFQSGLAVYWMPAVSAVAVSVTTPEIGWTCWMLVLSPSPGASVHRLRRPIAASALRPSMPSPTRYSSNILPSCMYAVSIPTTVRSFC
jgi:hypothetical protein